jgi:hypothetical protein
VCGKDFWLTLIARRSRHFAGTRLVLYFTIIYFEVNTTAGDSLAVFPKKIIDFEVLFWIKQKHA